MGNIIGPYRQSAVDLGPNDDRKMNNIEIKRRSRRENEQAEREIYMGSVKLREKDREREMERER